MEKNSQYNKNISLLFKIENILNVLTYVSRTLYE